MDPERWREIDAVFTGAFQREGGERDSFLSKACQGDDALRAEVDDLLASAEAAEGYFGLLAAGIAAPRRP